MIFFQLSEGGFDIFQVVEIEADIAGMLDDGFVGTDGEDAREGAIVEFVGFVLTAVLVYLDATVLACAVFCIVADDVIEDIKKMEGYER